VKKRPFASIFAFAVASSIVGGCGSDFTPKNQVNGVRILAARADQSYARPGESVRVQVLAHDGRVAPSEPMRLFWFPVPCVNPPTGQYYACYPAFEALFPVGVDLTPSLVEGKELTVTIPPNALESAVVRPGQGERYATAYVFMVACPGHVERVPLRGGLAPNAVPVGCVNARGEQLPADQFVFGYTRIFVFEERRNAIPNLDGLTFEGKPVDPAIGLVTERCREEAENDTCKRKVKLDTLFNDAAAETDPDNVDSQGKVGRETLYVDWFTSVGKFQTDRKILFDGNLGRTPKSAIDFNPPLGPAKGTVWAVLHDNRGGTTWLEVPIEIR
jgi:hypothetical protein